MKDLQSIALLFDLYGSLLTPRQQELIRSYYLEDLSLAEIAEESGVSRQAVHDLIKRSESALHEYEQRLGFLHEHLVRQQQLAELERAIQIGDAERALAILENLKQS